MGWLRRTARSPTREQGFNIFELICKVSERGSLACSPASTTARRYPAAPAADGRRVKPAVPMPRLSRDHGVQNASISFDAPQHLHRRLESILRRGGCPEKQMTRRTSPAFCGEVRGLISLLREA